jgi:hypothetical protein
MDFFDKHLLRQEYQKLAQLSDKLAAAEHQLDWKRFRPILVDIYTNDTEKGGRSNHDPVLMVRLPGAP